MKKYVIVDGRTAEAETVSIGINDLSEIIGSLDEKERALFIGADGIDFKTGIGIAAGCRLAAAAWVGAPTDDTGFYPRIGGEALSLYFVTAPDCRHQGLAGEVIKLLDDILPYAKTYCAVAPSNQRAISVLIRNGRSLCSRRFTVDMHLRYVLVRLPDDRALFSDYRRIHLHDSYLITRSLAEGYRGMAVWGGDGCRYLWMAK